MEKKCSSEVCLQFEAKKSKIEKYFPMGFKLDFSEFNSSVEVYKLKKRCMSTQF